MAMKDSELSSSKIRRATARLPHKIALIYLIAASLWILLSDSTLALFLEFDTYYTNAQLVKGWLFVGVTAALLYLTLRHQLRKLDRETAVRQQTEQELQALLQAMPLAVIQMDRDGLIQYWNEPAEAMFGWSAAEVIGHPLPYVLPENQAEANTLIARVIAGESFVGIETVRLTKAGDPIHLSISTAPLRNIEGEIIGLIGVITNITDRKQTEEALRQSESRFRLLAENAQDVIYRIRIDPERQFEYVSPSVTSITGYTPEEHYRNPNLGDELVHPEDRVKLIELFQDSAALARPLTLRWLHKDGRTIWTEQRIHPISDAAGKIIAIEGISRDITDRLANEEQLRLQGAALDAAANGIVITDHEGIIQWVNPAFANLTQYTPQEARGHNPRELVKSGQHQPVFYQEMWDTITQGNVWQGELINRRKDGSMYYEEQTITPLHNEAGQITHFVGIKQDITRRKQDEQARYLLLALPNAINDAPSLEAALEAALSLVCEYTHWDLGEVWTPIIDPDTNEVSHLELLTQYHQHPDLDKGFLDFSSQFRFPPGTGLPGRVWATQDLVWISDVTQDPTFLRAEMAAALGFRVAMGLPIMLDGAVTAVMCFFLKGNRQKDDKLVNLMSGVARQSAAAFQRKQYLEQIYQSQRLAQIAIDALSAHIAVLDENGVIITVNQTWLDFARFNGANLQRTAVGVNYLDICAAAAREGEQDAAQMLAGIQAVMRGEQDKMTLEYPCPSPNELRWFIAHVTPLPGDDPKRRRVVIGHEDITARKQAEEALRDSEQHYRLLFDNNPQPMWVYDLETLNFLAVNDAAIGKYGYNRHEFLGMTILDIRPPEDRPLLLENIAQARTRLQKSGEWRHQLRNGQLVDVEINSHEIDFNGRSAALVVAFDVTERKQAAAERQAQTRRLQKIMDTIPEGVVLLQETGQVTLTNPLGQSLLMELCGRSVGERVMEINGRSLADLLEPTSSGTNHTMQKDNRHFELLAQPVTTETAVGDWVLLLRDITEEYERQQYLEVQNRLATVGQLAAGIAHDFNNVMAVIILYTQLLQTVAEPTPKAADYLKTINSQAQHAAKMISQILDFSRRSVMERSPINLLPMLKELVRLLKSTLPETIAIDLLYDSGEYLISADPTRLQQAFMNVAVNARDAMPHGGNLQFILTPYPLAANQAPPLPDMPPGDWLRLIISDTGTGIKPEDLPHIFEPFYTTKEVGKGTGLGLAQLYGIIKQHEGYIDIESQPGHGSSFIIYLPVFLTPAQAAPAPSNSELFPTGHETILLVEDNSAIRASIAEALTRLGYAVLKAEHGLEALDILNINPGVDLVLSDVVMPQMDGVSLYRAVIQRNPHLKMLLMSGYPLQDRDGADLTDLNWIEKPFDLDQLARELRQLLDRPAPPA
jgi:two-component system, cell cycle sensor histidine kinase and response regulator CckA